MPVKVTKGGNTFEIDDSEDSLEAARAKGYKPLITVTKNGKDTFDLDADDAESVKAAFNKGYKEINAFNNLEASRKEGRKDIGKLESFGQGVASAATFGFDDELSAMLAPGKYDENIETIRRMKKNREEANPISNFAGNVVGGAAIPGMGAAKAATTLGRAGIGAGIGAVQGGIQGVGDSEAQDASGVLADAGMGALTGGAIGGLTGGLVRPKATAREIADVGKKVADVATEVPGVTKTLARGFKEGAKSVEDIGYGTGAIKTFQGVKGAAQEILEQKKAVRELAEAAGQPWPGPKDNWSDASVIVEKALSGGEYNSATDYIANQAAAFGIDPNQYKKFLKMSPEELEKVVNFSKREAADDAAPLFQGLKDTFENVRTKRLGELKKQARGEFNTDLAPIRESLEKGYQNASTLKTTRKAMAPIEDAYEIILRGNGADAFGFAPGDINTLSKADLFDRLQAARSHIDDNIDWAAIRKGNRSPTPSEKTLMEVRKTLDQALKGGSDAKIESDALFRKSKELEDRFFKLASDKDGQHEVSLAKIFGDNDRAAKAKPFLKEVEEFAARPDLPDEMRESTKALADNLRSAMEVSENKRALQEFQRQTRGPSGPSIERMQSLTRGNHIATDLLTAPSSALDIKARAAGLAREGFGKEFSQLNEKERRGLIDYLTWQRERAIAQKPIRPQEAAAKWQELLGKE